MLSDPAPRPPRCYDPTTPPHRDEQGVHVYDHATIRALLRDPQRVTSDVSEMLAPEQRDRLHPVSSFVWATDRRTVSGCPGRHAALRSAMAPWFAAETATRRAPAAADIAAELLAEPATTGAFDLYHYHRCAGLHHARTVAVATVTALAQHCPGLTMAGAWKRYVGIDDAYVAAPVVTLPDRRPQGPR